MCMLNEQVISEDVMPEVITNHIFILICGFCEGMCIGRLFSSVDCFVFGLMEGNN